MKRVVGIILALCLSVGLFSCSPGAGVPKVDVESQVWSAPNTEKIMKDKKYPDELKNSSEVHFESAKDEYENGQIIVTPNGRIDKAYLTACDLKNANGGKISKDNIGIFFQKYINIEGMSSPNATANFGYHPDALVPMKELAEKNENFIEKDTNQGFWITIKTPRDVASGTYTGNFTLELDSKTILVPVKLVVWDIVMPQEFHTKSSFYNFKRYLIGGELDNTDAMYEKYFDYMLDYRITVSDMPVFDNEVQSYVDAAKKYTADTRCASYNMKYKLSMEHVTMDGVIDKYINETDWSHFILVMKELAKQSTPDLNLLRKLYIYDIALDEPEGTNRIPDANYKQIMLERSLAEVVKQLDEEHFDWQAKGVTKEQILGVEHVVTGRYLPSMPNIGTFCPTVSDFTTEEQREFYKNRNKEGTHSTWWYDAWQPQFPYPNYRIEESSVGSRVMGWMQKDYDISGLLYWGTSVYGAVGSGDLLIPEIRDPYEDPYSFLQMKVTSDGCLTYPGRRYGIYGPVSSIRLESIRDGLEDYEYLYMLEKMIEASSVKYGVNFDFDSIIGSIYDSLYSGVIPNYDGEQLLSARREVASMIELINDASGAIIKVDDINALTNIAKLSVYTGASTTLKADGTAVSGESINGSNVFKIEKLMTEADNSITLTFTTGGVSKTVVKYLGKKSYYVNNFNNETANWVASRGHSSDLKDHIYLSKNKVAGLSDNSIKIDVSKYETESVIAEAVYSPEISIAKELAFANISASELDRLQFTMYNASAQNKNIVVYLSTDKESRNILNYTLKPGANTVTIDRIYLNNWSKLDSVSKIKIAFDKKEEGVGVYYIDNMYYTAV